MGPYDRDGATGARRSGRVASRRDGAFCRSFGFACTVALAACAGDQGPELTPDGEEEAGAATSVVVQPGRLDLAVPGDTTTLVVVAYNKWGYPIPDEPITWWSADTSLVTVDVAGRVRARALGRAWVAAEADGVADTVQVEVDPVHSVARNCAPCHDGLPGEHAALLLPMGSCWSCHVWQEWGHLPPERDHFAASNGTVLAGVHDSVACAACHTDGQAAASPLPSSLQDCVACHRDDYERNHGTLGFPTSCAACHAPTLWSDVTFDHETASGGFALLWAHTSVACFGCHALGTFEPRYTPADEQDCIACHQARYDTWHADDAYPTTCLSCHDPTTWAEPSYPHRPGSGGFELLGAHASLPCTACHEAGTFEPLYSPVDEEDCVACHRDDYDATHAGSSFPTTCADCHTPTVWSDGAVDHEAVSGGFQLWGAHVALACTACHVAGTFEPLYAPAGDHDCVACHQDDYDAAHADSGYPPTCLVCHDGVTWSGAVFDHDAQYFPIYSGEHRNRWESGGCPTCHTSPADFGIFTCFACHRHSERLSDADHGGVAGYVYDSRACLSCHPDGTA